MMEYKFRDLRADEIDCRISTVKEKGITLLLYKDARVDQNILDETVGPMNWQNDYKEIKGNMYCYVSIFDETKDSWITKSNCGVESYSEKEKGEASDAFKRACFNWGIGRELYTAPRIWIPESACEIKSKQDHFSEKISFACYDRFYVSDIEIKDKKIVSLTVKEERSKRVVFSTSSKPDELDLNNKIITKTVVVALRKAFILHGIDEKKVLELYKLPNLESATQKKHDDMIKNMDKLQDVCPMKFDEVGA